MLPYTSCNDFAVFIVLDVQIKKGLLEVCVLKALTGGESYGYKIIKDVSAYIEISESTLYPILKRLEADGHLVCATAEYNGRLRKYYSITPSGRERIRVFLEEWKEVMTVYRYIRDETGETKDAQN